MRVSELVGFHAVLHQTSMLWPSMAGSPGPLAQQGVGGLAFRV